MHAPLLAASTLVGIQIAASQYPIQLPPEQSLVEGALSVSRTVVIHLIVAKGDIAVENQPVENFYY